MEIFKPNPEITVENILSYISQEEIMGHYLGKSPSTTRGMFCSPLRKDKHPTCTFAWINGKLLFRDWAKENHLDCFGIVMEMYNLSYPEAIKKVASDFNLIKNVRTGDYQRREVKVDFTSKKDYSKSKFEVKIQTFTEDNIQYLTDYHITSQICEKFNVYSPKYVWINDKINYVYDNMKPALAYYFGLDEQNMQKWKIYFYRKTDYPRFLTNTNRINGWVQLPETAENLVITKSLKDVMCLDIFNIPAIAMQAETQTPYDYIIEEVKNRFNNIVTLFDYDDAGIQRAEVINQMYEIPYYFIQDENAKDFSDYIKLYGKDKARDLLQDILCNYCKS